MEAKYKRLKEDTKLVTPEEKKVVSDQLEKFRTEWRKRKKMAMNCVDILCEKSEQKPKKFMEDIGVETDEECRININEMGK